MFDNNLGKCGLIFKIFHKLIRRKILYVYTTKISTLPAVPYVITLWNLQIEKCYWIFILNVTINMFN